jgi:hypothetical protein
LYLSRCTVEQQFKKCKFTFLLDIKWQDPYFKNHDAKHVVCGPSADSSNVKKVGHVVTAVLSQSNTTITS